MTEDEMDKLATKIANAKGPLANVSPATARERLDNLIHHDREWVGRVNGGELTANQEFKALTRMVAEHLETTQKQELETAQAAWSKEQKLASDAKDAQAAQDARAIAAIQGGETV